ncbi:thioredoxin-like [Acipenser oxyrinchus oxyrinchus]|uniref:Thioredoxin n=1 Tax=Acipenser oxyrinchus oxyrinchus TaxID=40147 RepID=A0AAD8GIY8_ACIOX|nr:thioredoxin-like [Acipenser oxyrinchus oxyrinchus]
MVHEIEDKDQFDKALKNAGSKLVIVDFTATWCGPCKSISPFSYALAENYKDVVFLKVDVDEAQDVAEVCQIKCMPTFQYYKNGKKIDEFAGSNRETLEQKLMANK